MMGYNAIISSCFLGSHFYGDVSYLWCGARAHAHWRDHSRDHGFCVACHVLVV